MITLKRMTLNEFDAYLQHSVKEYAAEKVRAGNWPEEGSLERSRKEFEHYLPQGLETPDHYLCTICDQASGSAVGMIWYGQIADRQSPHWFIYDFSINEDKRGQGYAKAALIELESLASKKGISDIMLHVFGHNTAARQLYEKAGYEVTNVQMKRKVGS